MRRVYLDWAATADIDNDVLRSSLIESCRYFANPSSPHKQGREAKAFINKCRHKLSSFWGIEPEKLLFTSGGTESNNIVISSFINKKKVGNCVISSIEHDSVYEVAKYLETWGWEIRTIKPNKEGVITAKALLSVIDKKNQAGLCNDDKQ